MCCWLPLAGFDPYATLGAMEAARCHARAEGYPVLDGGTAEYVTEPDRLGGCVVLVELPLLAEGNDGRSVVAVVRRSSALVDWQVTKLSIRDHSIR
ncbi:MAG: hypothetical protein LC104_04050 [Bacteroidales bacterium]|nr:hypothetical protein [Bacteroidales bacterium]